MNVSSPTIDYEAEAKRQKEAKESKQASKKSRESDFDKNNRLPLGHYEMSDADFYKFSSHLAQAADQHEDADFGELIGVPLEAVDLEKSNS